MAKPTRLVTLLLVLMPLGLSQVGFAESPENQTVRYWAVICGVADYNTISDLAYTDDDASDLAAALKQYGVWQGPDQIEVLIDSAASKAGIREAIARMRDKANAVTDDHDVFLFFFSGHGTYVMDKSGDEADGVDEAICPWDIQFKGRTVSNIITDDEIGSWLAELPADGDVVAIFDTCFSGGMADGTKGAGVKGVRNPLLPPGAKVRRHFGGGLERRLAARGKPAEDTKPAGTAAGGVGGANAVVLMACEEGGVSYETKSLENGIFSYYLVAALGGPETGAPADENDDGGLTAEETFQYAGPKTIERAEVLGYTQIPQLFDGDLKAQTLLVDLTGTPPPPPPPPTEDVVTVTKAEYNTKTKELKVEATSTAPGGAAVLTVEGYGQMTYDKAANKYVYQAKKVADPEGWVTVTSNLGGSATAAVKYR